MSLNESTVENATLEWFGELAYACLGADDLAPQHGERDSYAEVVLAGRLREAIRRLNPAIPDEASARADHANRWATMKHDLMVQTKRTRNHG